MGSDAARSHRLLPPEPALLARPPAASLGASAVGSSSLSAHILLPAALALLLAQGLGVVLQVRGLVVKLPCADVSGYSFSCSQTQQNPQRNVLAGDSGTCSLLKGLVVQYSSPGQQRVQVSPRTVYQTSTRLFPSETECRASGPHSK